MEHAHYLDPITHESMNELLELAGLPATAKMEDLIYPFWADIVAVVEERSDVRIELPAKGDEWSLDCRDWNRAIDALTRDS